MSPRHRRLLLAIGLSAVALTSCGSLEYSVDETHTTDADASTGQSAPWLPEPTGPMSIGSSTRWIDLADRSLPIQLWYPTESFLTTLAEDLASHGYLVAALDHPGDTLVTETSTGELIPGGAEPSDELLATRVGDVNAAISYLTAGGDNVLDTIDADRVAVLGHSYGGATAAQVAATNTAVSAVGVLDGSIFGTAAEDSLDLPRLVRSFLDQHLGLDAGLPDTVRPIS